MEIVGSRFGWTICVGKKSHYIANDSFSLFFLFIRFVIGDFEFSVFSLAFSAGNLI